MNWLTSKYNCADWDDDNAGTWESQPDESSPWSGSDTEDEKEEVKAKAKVNAKRGTGLEATKTHEYITCNTDSSLVKRELIRRFGKSGVTIQLLLTLIQEIQASFSEESHLSPLTRKMKRAKNGLIIWLDNNESATLKYLCCEQLIHPS
jgi:hypothetical protein